MARTMDLTAESPHSLPRIRSAFQNEAYWQHRLIAFEGASPTLDSLATDTAGRTSVSMTMGFGGDQLPDSLRRLRLAGLEIVQREEWFADESGRVRGEIGVDALRTPISGHGAVLLTAVDPGTRLMGTASVEVGVPLIGGTIARFIAGLLANGIVDIVGITDSWLDENYAVRFMARRSLIVMFGEGEHVRVDNTLAYIDQGSFLALRALGRGPLIQFTWVYDRSIDVEEVRRFHANLGLGLLGRRIERSALPFGRDRWVASPGPPDIQIAARDRAPDDVWTWADERLRLPIDPQHGPTWHLGIAPLVGGGAALTLVVSHSVGDAKAIIDAIAEAVRGARRDLGYPMPGSRTRRQAVSEDGKRALRDVPEVAKAVVSAARVARAEREGLSTSVKSGGRERRRGADREVVVPNATVFFDLDHWDRRASELGGSSNSLFVGLGARLGEIIGRVDDEGRVRVSLPVSERVADDTRANALTATTVIVDPATVSTDLATVRKDLKQALTALAKSPNELLGPLALVPLTPAFLVRRLEGMVQQVGSPVGCSNLGELPPEMNRPDGGEADRLAVRMLEPKITTKILDRMGGLLFLGSGRIHGHVFVTVGAWVVDGPNTRAALHESVRRALADMSLTGRVE